MEEKTTNESRADQGERRAETRKLYRSKSERIIAGVCGGLAEYFNIEPILVRLIFIFLALLNGAGILLYIILALFIPGEPGDAHSNRREKLKGLADDARENIQEVAASLRESRTGRGRGRTVFGAIIVIIGLLILWNQLFPMYLIRWDLIWPVILIMLGLAIITRVRK